MTFSSVLLSFLNKPVNLGRGRQNEAPDVSKMSSSEKGLADALVASGSCDAFGITRAWKAAQEGGKPFEQALVKLSIATESAIADATSRVLNLPKVNAADFPASPVLAVELRPCFLRSARCCPIRVEDGRLLLAVIDGFDEFTPAAIAAKTNLIVDRTIALPIDLTSAFARLYPDASDTVENARELAKSSQTTREDVELIKDDDGTAFVIKYVHKTLNDAAESFASDLHFETFQDHFFVRFRYDGRLSEVDKLPQHLSALVISRLKVMAQLDIAERRLPQDGRFKLSVRGVEVNFRLSTLPSLHGEKAVVRILDQSRVPLDLAALGYSTEFTRTWSKCLKKESGIILVVGPTGSGKSTTLYTSLKMLAVKEKNIATVEDPIEFQLPGINQTQIKPQIGLDFARCLRSILRQDPDIIMIGEIRDLETAEIAVQAAMTGHLVLSTLHAESAAGAIARLRDLGLEDYAISSVVRAIAAQRLLRRLCECKRPEGKFDAIQDVLTSKAPQTEITAIAYRPVGCPRCRGTGYLGRFAVAELAVPTKAVRALIERGASQTELETALQSTGFDNILEVAHEAVGKGLTDVDEVASLREVA